MSTPELSEIRERRLHSTRAAALVGLMARRTGVDVDLVSWEALSTFPSWCLASVVDRQQLQSVCGAIVLQPYIQSTIDGDFLRTVRSEIGLSLLNKIRTESIYTSDGAPGLVDAVPRHSLMEYGASVLLATLTDSRLRSLFEKTLGENVVEIDTEIAHDIFIAAEMVTGEEYTGNPCAAKP